LPELTAQQQEIRDDFMRYWHERLGDSPAFGPIESFNHGYPVKQASKTFRTTLEIGAGLGEHLRYEKLTDEQKANYHPLELRANMVEQLRARFPGVKAIQGDCQGRLDFPDNYFDRIIAIHVLEHLPNLPAAVQEMHRLCNKEHGLFSIVIPCEGGLAYTAARLVSAQRLFEQRYKQPYKWFIEQEHLSVPDEIIKVLEKFFEPVNQEYFPFNIPLTAINLCIGITLSPKKNI
jgi:SAM-dependent methyltransferase